MILAGSLTEGAGWSQQWWLIDPFSMSLELVFRIFGAPGSGGENDLAYPEISTVAVLGSCIAWTVGGLGVVAWRYSRLVIAR